MPDVIAIFKSNWILFVVSAICSIAAPYIVDFLQCWKKDCWIYSFNKYLKQKANPLYTFLLQVLFFIVIVVSGATLIYFLVYKPFDVYTVLTLIVVLLALLMMVWEHLPAKKDSKGLIAIVSHKIRKINPTSINASDSIFFATHFDSSNNELSYEVRQPILDEKVIEDIRRSQIVPYYTYLKTKIKKYAENKQVNELMFNVGDTPICDFMIEEAYSLPSLMEHIRSVNDSMASDNSINFIGDKIGVSGYSLVKGELLLKIYLTDHFTFKVFKDIFLDKKYKETFQLIIRRINYASELEKELLVESLKFLFSSVGIDIVIHGRRACGKKGLLLALRNGGIEMRKESKIHVPVNESFSKTDQQENANIYDLQKCVSRGIEEELGISQDWIEKKCSVDFQDFAIVSDEGEIGFACYVDFSDLMPLEQARMYPGQDKFMEIKDLVVVPMPQFFLDPDKYREYFYSVTQNDVFCNNWESFTPVLYQRFVVRNKKLSAIESLVGSYFVSVLIFMYFSLLFNITHLSLLIFMMENLFAFLVLIVTVLIKDGKKTSKYPSYKLFRPLIPQWNGDATIVQSTGANIDQGLFENMYFGCDDATIVTMPLDKLELIAPPYCKTRKEGVKNHTEVPISFYRMKVSDTLNYGKRLFMKEIPVSYISSDNILRIWLGVNFYGKHKSYRFLKDVPVPVLTFDNFLSQSEINSFSKYFSLPDEILQKYKIARISKKMNGTEKTYHPLDLFQYQDNYFWIIKSLSDETGGDSVTRVQVGKDFDIYKKCVALVKEDTEYILEGNAENVINALVKFINKHENRGKISSIDIYALQMSLMRTGNGNESLLLVQKERKCFGTNPFQ